MTTLVFANSVESEIGINIGLNSTQNEGSNTFKNPMLGISYQNNNYIIMPRIDVEYVNVKNDKASSLLKASVNGVYEIENSSLVTPYAVAGVGYEYVQGGSKDVFDSRAFVQAGLGIDFALVNDMKAQIESRYLQVLGDTNQDNELIVTAGVTFPLTYNEVKHQQKRPRRIVRRRPRVKPRPIVVPQTRIVYSSVNECSIKISAPDLDRDGVEDRIDQCPATPCNFTVDSYGCPIKMTLKIHFATGSARITSATRYKVSNFAQFLLQNKGSFITIKGHTDSVGSASYNLKLSQRRANAVMQALMQQGVSSARLQAKGRGEREPIASNKSASGRAKNRRIEAHLSYPKGRS